jgi:hypothetical protein
MMKKPRLLPLVIIAAIISLSVSNYILFNEIRYLRGVMHENSVISSDNSMKLEMFLQMMSNEFEGEVKRIARPIAREEVIKGFKQFAENFGKEVKKDLEENTEGSLTNPIGDKESK